MKKLLALLLAIAMLVTLCACGKKDKDDKGVSNDPEAVAEAFAKAYELDDYASFIDLYAYDFEAELKDEALNEFDSEEAFFEEMSEEFDEKISSWKSAYKAVLNRSKEYSKEKYGSDYKIKTKVTDTEDLDEEGIEECIYRLQRNYKGYIDEDKVDDIKDAKDITVEVSISGKNDENSYTLIVTVVKIDGKWKVAYDEFVYEDDYEDDYDDYYDDYYDEDEYYDER